MGPGENIVRSSQGVMAGIEYILLFKSVDGHHILHFGIPPCYRVRRMQLEAHELERLLLLNNLRARCRPADYSACCVRSCVSCQRGRYVETCDGLGENDTDDRGITSVWWMVRLKKMTLCFRLLNVASHCAWNCEHGVAQRIGIPMGHE